ncbi:hypothetical protein, partial [Methylobacterium sp. WL9]|uniref:hypothetical protein n=1 Tax=Methylobacterium sp. WL9 TaxID=2603898 RepID=UPI001AED94E2
QDGRDQDRTGSAEACAQAVPSPRAGFAASIAISPIRHKQQSTTSDMIYRRHAPKEAISNHL